MRITLVIEHFAASAGGAEGMAVSVVRGLLRRGHEVQVVAATGRALEGCPLHLVPRERHAETARALGGLLLDWGLTVPADVHRLGGGLTAAFLKHNAMPRRPEIRWLKRLLDRFSPKHWRSIRREDALLRRPAARFIAVSEFVARQVRERVPDVGDRLAVLYNGVDVNRFQPGNRDRFRQELRREWGVPEDAVLFLFVAHNPRLKNFQLLARVFHLLTAELPRARLVILGKHRVMSGGAPWLVHAGAVAEPERAYAAADVLLHPTYYDACANVVLEALAAGMPVVSSAYNGSAELITSGVDGFVLPVDGIPGGAAAVVTEWAQAVRWLAVDPSLRAKVGVAARRLAEAHSMDAYIAGLEAVLASAVRQG